MSQTEPDFNEANRFLKLLYGENATVCFQTFWPHKEEKKRAFNRYRTLQDAFPGLSKLNVEGHGVYFMVNEGDGLGRQAKNVVAVTAVFVDLDGSPVEYVQKASIKPHIITQTSADRHQAFWKVSDCPLDKFKPIIKGLAKRFEGDEAVADLSRVMRLPGFFNTKRTPPFFVKILETHDGPVFKWSRLVSGLGVTLDYESGTRNAEYYDDQKPIGEGGRHRYVANLCYRLRSQGLGPDVLRHTVLETNETRCTPPLSETEIDRIIKGTLKNVAPKDYSRMKVAYEPHQRTMQPSLVMSWPDLYKQEFPPTNWIVKGLLPAGLSILAGRPKVGKSWLTQALCLWIARGDKALGVFECNQGKCLSLSLEDTPQRFQARMKMICNGSGPPEDALFANRWPRMNDGGLQFLQDWLEEHKGQARLVVIDTLAKIRPKGVRRSEEGVYDKDYSDVGELQQLAGDYQVAIVLVHHQRKAEAEDSMDKVSGSVGITGAADTIFTLHRKDRSKFEGFLEISGRDISDRKYDLKWNEDKGLWLYEGETGIDSNSTQDKIIQFMKTHGKPVHYKNDLGAALKLSHTTINNQLSKLQEMGIVDKSAGRGGFWYLVGNVGIQTCDTEVARLQDGDYLMDSI